MTANAHANSKQQNDHKEKAHKVVGPSPVDFPHKDRGHKDHGHKDHKHHDHHGKDHHNGDDNCGKNSSTPPKEYMGGSVYHPPGTPGNPVMPSKPTLPTTPIKYYRLTNHTLATSLLNQHKNLTRPGGGRPGQGRTPNSLGPIPNIGTGWRGFEGAVVAGVGALGRLDEGVISTSLHLTGAIITGVTDAVGAAGSLLSDAGSAIGSFL